MQIVDEIVELSSRYLEIFGCGVCQSVRQCYWQVDTNEEIEIGSG